MSEFPRNLWYPLFLTREITKRPQRFERFGEIWMVCRLPDGALLMTSDRCPHLGASLSSGSIRNGQVQCPFHGFCFNKQGDCTHIPALGPSGKIASKLKLRTIPLREVQGWIWGWWGNAPPDETPIPLFNDMDQRWRGSDISSDWDVHMTRAIENQLDVAHLPFVHRNSIGAGGRTRVDGPYVESDAEAIRVWVTNRKEDGHPPKTLDMLKDLAERQPPNLEYRFPGLWQLRIHPRLRLLVAFVPVNPRKTRFYIRSCHQVRIPFLGALYSHLLAISNRWILREDERVVRSILPPSSLDAHEDILIASDRAIVQFRKMWRRRLEASTEGGKP